jgi:hypothetical protein
MASAVIIEMAQYSEGGEISASMKQRGIENNGIRGQLSQKNRRAKRGSGKTWQALAWRNGMAAAAKGLAARISENRQQAAKAGNLVTK